MKYCTKCGSELFDEAIICVKCGVPTQEIFPKVQPRNTTLSILAKVFMVIGTVLNALLFCVIPLAWCIPMTVIYFSKCEKNEPVGVGFKVCSLLFVSLLAGIFMLVDYKKQ